MTYREATNTVTNMKGMPTFRKRTNEIGCPCASATHRMRQPQGAEHAVQEQKEKREKREKERNDNSVTGTRIDRHFHNNKRHK